uniref:integrin alpha-D-like n=1 Tax=Pristiophorus japonicus TaxID=55135 RepID=UPI00398EF447
MDGLLPALLCLLAGLLPGHSFNLDTDSPISFSQDQNSQFGHMVTQFQNGMLVSAPLMKDTTGAPTGAIYKCGYNDGACNKININLPKGSNNLGLSLTTGDLPQPKAVACVPRFAYECYTNTYINGYCEVLDATLSQSRRVPQKLPECPVVLIDIAFLIDGSGSVSQGDFIRMKDFMKAIIKKFSSKQTQIAVAQFSSTQQTDFDFNKYNQATNKDNLVTNIQQVYGGTDTPKGIQYVADHIFVTSAGARNKAKRILITITDGESYNTDFTRAIDTANRKKIQRYAIGVGSAFSSTKAKQQLETIASTIQNVFQVNNFDALISIQKELQEKIFTIEGQGGGAISSFQLEMAQEGFSTLVTSEAIVLGAVGAYDWSGGLAEFRGGARTFINLTASHIDMKNAYLGYTVKEARKGSEKYYIAGAPRYQHKGKIFVFAQGSGGVVREKIEGKQIGSYFGSELCPVDLNTDGQTDLVLVGAPMYHDQEIGGMVHVYKLSSGGYLQALDTLSGERGRLLGRFGTAIAEVRDLNGDGISDVAIGAPLEDGHQGSVYIYHGAKSRINPTPSQCIRSVEIASGLKYFGRSIHGSMDVSGDGLTDIAVGALGKVFVFRSRPVLDVTISMVFKPNKILLKDVDCPEHSAGPLRIQATICFSVHQLTKSALAAPSINISYELKLDPGRKIQRAELELAEPGSIILSNTHCLKPTIKVEDCIRDYYNPILLQVTFSGVGQQVGNNPPPILKQGNSGIYTGKLPFEQECGTDNICTDHLSIGFNFVGTRFLVVGSYSTLTVDVTLENLDENSYFTVVTFWLPTGLSFRKTSIIKASRRSHIECDDMMNSKFSSVGKVVCRVNHPIFRTMGKPSKASCEEKVPLSNTSLEGNSSQGCNASTCRVFVCQIKQLRSRQTPTFTIAGMVRWSNVDQVRAQELMLVSFAAVGYDETKYIHVSQATNRFLQATVKTRVEIVEVFNPLPIIVGSTIGGLVLLAIVAAILYKVGFFKRGYKDKLEEAGEETEASGSPPEPSAPDASNE